MKKSKALLPRLNNEDLPVIEILKKVLLRCSYKNQKTSDEVIEEVNRVIATSPESDKMKPLNQIRLRKMINHLRTTSALPIISGGNGYYVSYEDDDIDYMVENLNSRVAAINAAITGLQYIKTQKKLIDSIYGLENL